MLVSQSAGLCNGGLLPVGRPSAAIGTDACVCAGTDASLGANGADACAVHCAGH